MKKTTNFSFTLGLLALSVMLTGCQRQESDNPSTSVTQPSTVLVPVDKVAAKAATQASLMDNPAVRDLLQRVVRSDLPGMTFEQVKALFPKTCTANDDDRRISCPGVSGLVSTTYAGGPDGALDMVFSGGVATCNTLKVLVSQKFGVGQDVSDTDQNHNGACGMQWWKINHTKKTYHAHLRKLTGDDDVTLQIGAEEGDGP